jgi:O-acetyl-ADP-ribose deacetylase (regulator of RNase III)
MEIVPGDITAEAVDAIVNAANTDLILGAGVAGAIRVKGGPAIQTECDAQSPVKLGGAALTAGGNLPAKFVSHAAAMHLGGEPDEASIRKAVGSALEIASRERFHVVSFPAIGAGIGGFPMKEAAEIILQVVSAYLSVHEHPAKVRIVLFDRAAFDVFITVYNRLAALLD